jgi:hypothetical protein
MDYLTTGDWRRGTGDGEERRGPETGDGRQGTGGGGRGIEEDGGPETGDGSPHPCPSPHGERGELVAERKGYKFR